MKRIIIFLCVIFAYCQVVKADDSVKTELLGKISLEDLGSLTAKKLGYDYDLWQNSDFYVLESLLLLIDKKPQNSQDREILAKLLKSWAASPKNTPQDFSWLEFRLKLFILYGDLAGFKEISNLIPKSYKIENLPKLEVLANFFNKDFAKGCEGTSSLKLKDKLDPLRHLQIFCYAYKHEPEKFEFATQLLEEEELKLDNDIKQASILVKKKDKEKEVENLVLKYIKNSILNLSLPIVTLNQLQEEGDLISDNHLQKIIDKMATEKKTDNLVEAYYYLDSQGFDIEENSWYNLFIYAKNRGEESPILDAKILDLAIKNDRMAEIILLMLNSGENTPLWLKYRYIDVLTELGLDTEKAILAKKLKEPILSGHHNNKNLE